MQGWHIRPFISSTFQDMQAERDVLAADVFPRLRALCTGHGATLSEVDLRWGITEEDQQADRVLPLCLELVDRCRPYFIGLLGDRYGWVPVQIPPDLLRAEPWLDQFRNRSVTELEMQHGVLNHAREQTRAFFYFRTSPTGGAERAELSALKQRIESAGFRVRRYTESQELANVVFTDLSEAILHDLTGADEDADLREEQWQQRRLAQLRQGYLPRPDCHDALDRCTEKAAAPLLLTTRDEAEASLVLVNWAAGKAEAEAARRPAGGLGRLLSRLGLAVSESVLALTHTFHGSDPRAALTGMMRQVMLTYRKSTDGTLVIPEAPEPLRTAFAKWLRSAGRHRPVILALDGLSALEGADLSWVPRERLPGVHLVMAVGHGPVLDQLRSLGLQELIVGRQSLRGRELAVTQYLNRYGKRLLPDQVARIAQAHQSGNPVYLRALLEALRIYGDHRILQEQLNRFLSAQTATDLFDQVLERYETDYARPSSPGLVTRLFQYLLCARAGLMESELLALFQAEPTPVPPAWVLPLLTAAQDAGILTRGLVQFATDEAQAATRRRYLGMKPDLGPVHRHLAMLFLDHADPAGRGTECLYHLVHAKDWEALGMALSDSRRLLLTKPETLSSYWDLIQTHTSIRAAAVFLPLAGALAENILVLIVLAHLFTLLNDPENARLIEQHLEGLARGSSDVGKLITALSGLVLTAVDRQEWERACLYAKECEALAEAAEKWLELANVVCTHGLALYFAARPGEAHSLLLRFEERFQAEDRLDCLALCLTMRAQFSAKEGEQTRAEALMTRARQAAQLSGRPVVRTLMAEAGASTAVLAGTLSPDQIKVLDARGEELGGFGVAPLGGISQLLRLVDRGDLSGALPLAQEYELAAEQAGNLASQVKILIERGKIHFRLKQIPEAARCFEAAHGIAREKGYAADLSVIALFRGAICQTQGQYQEALEWLGQVRMWWTDPGLPEHMALALAQEAACHEALGRLPKAVALRLEHLRLVHSRKWAPEYVTFSEFADLLTRTGDYPAALELLTLAQDCYRGQEDAAWLGVVLAGICLAAAGCCGGTVPPATAFDLCTKVEHVARRTGIAAVLPFVSLAGARLLLEVGAVREALDTCGLGLNLAVPPVPVAARCLLLELKAQAQEACGQPDMADETRAAWAAACRELPLCPSLEMPLLQVLGIRPPG